MGDWQERFEGKLDKLVDVTTDIRLTQTKMESDISRNTSDIADHIEGVKQNRARIEKLEEPSKARKWLKNKLQENWKLWAAILSTILAALGILKYFGFLAIL